MITASVLKGLREACHEYYLKFKSVYSQGIFKISISLSYENSRNTVLNHKTMRFVIRLCFNVTHNAAFLKAQAMGHVILQGVPEIKKPPSNLLWHREKLFYIAKKIV